jgi:flagellar basal body L-ring protein FlgH
MKSLMYLYFVFHFSCASYVNSIHRQFDSANQRKATRYKKTPNNYNKFNNPVTLNGIPSANSQRDNLPNTQRNYNSKGARRYRADDLVDNQDDGSLWTGKNSESFLFINSNLKKKGDIVIIEVMQELKDKIQEELKRSFPEKKTPKKKSKGKAADKAAEAPAPTPAATQDDPNKIHDKISTNVIEQINSDYVLIRGRKEVLYKKYKRYFEFQAIVSQKDVTSRDTVTSVKLLEPKINVLRY